MAWAQDAAGILTWVPTKSMMEGQGHIVIADLRGSSVFGHAQRGRVAQIVIDEWVGRVFWMLINQYNQ